MFSPLARSIGVACLAALALGAGPTTTPSPAQNDDLFSARLSGGTRGTADHPVVYLLLPKRPVAVADSRPTLVWYLDRDTPADQEVVISQMVDEGGGGPAADRRYTAHSAIHVTVPGPAKAGLQRLDLKTQPVELAVGIYKVTVMVTLNVTDVAGNPFTTGYIHHTATAPASDRWLPDLLDLCDGIDRSPADADLHRRRRQMLADADAFGGFAPPAADSLTRASPAERVALDRAQARAVADRDALLDRLDPMPGAK